MSSIFPPGSGGANAAGVPLDGELPKKAPQGSLLPADSPFVQAVSTMFGKVGMGENVMEMQQVATELLWSMQRSLSNQIKRETKHSSEKRKADLDRLLGRD